MPICAYRYCDIEFDIDPSMPGMKQKYCCREHKKYENWLKWDEKKSRQKRENSTNNTNARKDAILNCKKYLECIDKASKNGNDIKCYQCAIKEIKKDAFKDELDQITYNTDENPIYLPDLSNQ